MLFSKTVNRNTNNIYSLETDLFDISNTLVFFFLILMIADPNLQVCTQSKSGDYNNPVHVDDGQGTINYRNVTDTDILTHEQSLLLRNKFV